MSEFPLPTTSYALNGDVNIAYQVMGEGPIDIVMVPGVVLHIEFQHELPGYTTFLRRLVTGTAAVARPVDVRGTAFGGFDEGAGIARGRRLHRRGPSPVDPNRWRSRGKSHRPVRRVARGFQESWGYPRQTKGSIQ